MVEGSIRLQLVSCFVLVCVQQLTQIKTFRIWIGSHIERITPCLGDALEWTTQFVLQ